MVALHKREEEKDLFLNLNLSFKRAGVMSGNPWDHETEMG